MDGNIKRAFSGGQVGMPFTMRATKKAGTVEKKDIAALPAMIQNLLSLQQIMPQTKHEWTHESLLYQKIGRALKKLHNIVRCAQEEIPVTVTNNSVRYEMFIATSKGGRIPAFARLDYVRSWLLSSPNMFLQEHCKSLEECMVPLRRVFLDIDPCLIASLASPTKGMLVLCSEMLVREADFFPFEGRICRRIREIERQWQQDSEGEDEEAVPVDGANMHQWAVPKGLLRPLQKSERETSKLLVGLVTDAMGCMPAECHKSG